MTLKTTEIKPALLHRLQTRSAVVAVIGLGYVGLPLAVRFAECSFRVIGLDIDKNKVSRVNGGSSYISSVADSRLEAVLGLLTAHSGFSAVSDADVVILCLPTPLSPQRDPDLSFITDTLTNIRPYLRQGQALILESTTWPGTTKQVVSPFIEALNFDIGNNFFVGYSPEREDPGNEEFTTHQIPKVVSGISASCLEVAETTYGAIVDSVVPVSSTDVAEMTKLLENIYRSVNIGLANEMKVITDAMGMDIHEVIAAASTKPFGFVPYFPGPGLGGHCIPIDPFYLTWKAREFGVNTKFIEIAGEVNRSMPAWVVEKILKALNQSSKAVCGSSILMLGIAYKKNIEDVRESPAIEIMKQLNTLGADIAYSDPYCPVFPKMRNYNFDLQSVSLSSEVLAEFDCVVLATDHDSFDYELIARHAAILVDTRGKFRGLSRALVMA